MIDRRTLKMKKYFVLLVVSSFFVSCTTISSYRTKPGRNFLTQRHFIIEQEQELSMVLRSYRILRPTRIGISSCNDPALEEDLKEVLYDFGFLLVREGNVDILLEAQKQDKGYQYTNYGYIGYGNRQKAIVEVKLIVVDSANIEHYHIGYGEYGYQQYSYGRSNWVDHRRFAAKIAAAHAVVDMIVAMKIPVNNPGKK